MNYELIHIHTRQSDMPEEGSLSFAEGEHDIPFDIKRIYYIYGVGEGIQRGRHAHKLNKQLLFCPYGKIEIIIDDGESRESVVLDDPSKGLVLYPGLWREMLWLEKDSILCVAASEFYDPAEYIRDYDDFKLYTKQLKKEDE